MLLHTGGSRSAPLQKLSTVPRSQCAAPTRPASRLSPNEIETGSSQFRLCEPIFNRRLRRLHPTRLESVSYGSVLALSGPGFSAAKCSVVGMLSRLYFDCKSFHSSLYVLFW